ncbi:MAG: FAD-binding oxidoreductase [Alphaproteobacteria bacterium]|nr:FAD-binding oxidoreductase [Alphaproteobacteria bacterium]
MTRYTAKRIPVHRGPAVWNALLPGQDAAITLTGDETADVVVIGAGFAGLSAARRLTQLAPKAKVIVLEAGRIAEGATGRNAGFMIDLPHAVGSSDYTGEGNAANRKITALNRKAIGFAKAMVDDFAIDRNYFDPAGKVNGATTQNSDALNKSYLHHLGEMGEKGEYLDAKAMAELTGSAYYLSGVYTPGTVMIQPAGYIRGLVRGLRKDGVKICEHSPVHKFEQVSAGWLVTSGTHKVSAGKVILATNGHLESFGLAKQRLMHIFLFGSMTVDLPIEALKKLGGKPRWGVTPSDSQGTTMRRIDAALGGNRIMTRSCISFLPDMEVSEGLMKRAIGVHKKRFAARFPALKNVPMEHSWAGHLCLTRNGVAVMREVDKGLYSACVQNGLGTVRGTLTGIGAAELACGVASDITQHFTSEAEPTKLPPRPFSTIGANVYLRWKERLAARE